MGIDVDVSLSESGDTYNVKITMPRYRVVNFDSIPEEELTKEINKILRKLLNDPSPL